MFVWHATYVLRKDLVWTALIGFTFVFAYTGSDWGTERTFIEWADKHDYDIYSDGLVVRTTIDSRLQIAANKAVTKQLNALKPLAIGLQYPALDKGNVDVANVFSTDAQLTSGKYTVLKDPKGVFGYQNVLFVIDKKKLDATTTGSYAIQPGRKDVRVFVIDTGADQFHPDVAPNLDVPGSRSFVPSESSIQDFNGHGTWTISS